MRKSALVLTLLTACSARPVDSDCDGMCQPAGPLYPGVGECRDGVCTPTYSECVHQGDVSTCAEACEAQVDGVRSQRMWGYTYGLYYTELEPS